MRIRQKVTETVQKSTSTEPHHLSLKGDNRDDTIGRPLEKVAHVLHQDVVLGPPERPEELGETSHVEADAEAQATEQPDLLM